MLIYFLSSVILVLIVVLIVLVFRNRRSLKEAIEQRERAERSEDVKRRFLANMSHEIRTPMNAVTGMTSLVLNTELTDKQRSYLENIRISADNLLQIINDILDFSKIEVGKMELENLDFSISEVVEHVRKVVQYKGDEKGLQIITIISPEVNDILLGDSLRLNQVLINLMGNGIKFTEKGSVSLEITQRNEVIRFNISDTGIGIPPEKLRFVFDSFNQANASDTRKYGGTGLGLSISQQLVELMGGTIDIQSEVDRGTTFTFEIPFQKGDSKRYQEKKNQEKSFDGSALDGLKILIADDNEFNRIIAREMLESNASVAIIEAENGEEAIQNLDTSVDLILMDGQMPVMNGFDATRKIRELSNEKLQKIPIVAFTASVLRSDLDKCMDSGMNGYIPKPFKSHQLITGIASVMGIRLKTKASNNASNENKSQRIETPKVIDIEALYEFCDGNKKKMAKYIQLFQETAPVFQQNLEKYIEQNNSELLFDLLHTFGTKLTLMGMTESKTKAVEAENSLRKGQSFESVKGVLNDLTAEVEQALRELETIVLD